jgi:hypothetical protein
VTDDDHPERIIHRLSRSHMSDVLLTCYFLGACIATGIAGLISDEFATGTLIQQDWGYFISTGFSVGMLLTGIGGVIARLADSRMGELYAIIGVAVFTILNGVLLLPDHPQVSLRLLFAPCMMVPYAWLRLGLNISRGQVQDIQRAIVLKSGDKGES